MILQQTVCDNVKNKTILSNNRNNQNRVRKVFDIQCNININFKHTSELKRLFLKRV